MVQVEATGTQGSGILIVYDGECPVCSHYVNGLRLREAGGQLRLQNAREETDEVRELVLQGFDLDQGMVVKLDGSCYFGADAMHVLSMMTTPSGLFNRFVYLLFRAPTSSRLLYPVFRGLRLLLLRIIGVPPIRGDGPADRN